LKEDKWQRMLKIYVTEKVHFIKLQDTPHHFYYNLYYILLDIDLRIY